ncbi:ankyrin repeat domain-containing protein 27-like [Mercenaria mercenaria]|uniref:ankyrin repeat domain-containing protein 27-like n=1 Tax=Mercenaria mercenaria TaxID=6596 RepID=UPI00234F8276|nr:ankyrin repeat domain-containing protein 27-like [Mercenaria mercenaria]
MSQYDEDIYENPFFSALEKQYKTLFEKATTNRWVICVPRFSIVKKDELVRKDFEDHILIPAVDNDSAFTTVSNYKVEIQQGQINLGAGLKANKVDILFEETFYNVKDESYRVVCVSGFFNKEIEQGDSADTNLETDFSKPPATYEECIKILWGHQGSTKTRENLDKMLKVFCGEYQRFEGTADSIPNLTDLVSSHVTKAMQIVLKDQHIKKLIKQNEMYMSCLKIAVETYMMNAVHKHLFSTITACVKSSDALVNKMARNLFDIRLANLDVRPEFEENLPYARKELSRLNQYSTPLGRVFCLKRVITALTKPLFKSQENEGLVMTSDDLLPLLIYLILKSQIPNWTANLMYMKHFQMAKMSESDEFSFYLATTEAALDFISSGNLKQTKSAGYSKETGFNRQASGSSTSSKEKFFQYVQYGDESAVSLMLKKPIPTTEDISTKLCHPLCTCDKCSEITAVTSQNSGAVSSIARDDMGRTALHIAAFYGQGALIDILAKHGCLTDATDYLGCTPLHLAAQKGFQNIILLLVHFGADIGAKDNEGNTPLHLCAKNGHEDCVKAILFLDILKNKLNVNAQNDMGDTPLHMAARWGYDGIVNFLLESEADPCVRNRKRQTPHNVAQNADIKKQLQIVMNDPPPMIIRQPVKPKNLPVHNHITTANPSSVNTPTPSSPYQATPDSSSTHTQDKTPLGFEVIDVKPRPPIQLLDNSSSEMMSPTTPAVASLDQANSKQIEKLYKAIANRDLPLVEYYFGWVDTSSSSEDSPISPPTTPVLSENIAAKLCHPLCQCEKCQHIQKNRRGCRISVIENNMEVLELLLKKGAFVNVQTHKHITPLHLACYHDQSEVGHTGWSFWLAVVPSRLWVILARYHNRSVLAFCINQLEIGHSCLLQYPVAAIIINLPDLDHFCPKQHSSTINLGNINGNTSLHHAVCTENVDVIGVLLKYGANPNALNKHNKSPLHMTKNPVILEMLSKKSKELHSKLSSVPKSVSAPEHLKDNHLQQGNDKLRTMATDIEQPQLDTLQQIGLGIKTFDKQKQLKRSETFDHSTPAIDDASLKLSLSIQHFDKEKRLRRAHTLDRSSAGLKSLEHSLSIQHFDFSSLKHVQSVDKSNPLHIYSLTRSFSCYSDYADTPTEDKAFNILGGNSKVIEETVESESNSEVIENTLEKEGYSEGILETTEEFSDNKQGDNSEVIERIVEECNKWDESKGDSAENTKDEKKSVNSCQTEINNSDMHTRHSENSTVENLDEIPIDLSKDKEKLEINKNETVDQEHVIEPVPQIHSTGNAEANVNENVINLTQNDMKSMVTNFQDNNRSREIPDATNDEIQCKTDIVKSEVTCDNNSDSETCKNETADIDEPNTVTQDNIESKVAKIDNTGLKCADVE